jgi:hypothetical protein
LGEEPVPILHALLPPIDRDPARAAGSQNFENVTEAAKSRMPGDEVIPKKAATSVTLKTFKKCHCGCLS